VTGVRVVPQRPRWVDAALVSLETTTALVIAHVAVGGMVPSVPWVVAMATSVFAVGLLALRGDVRALVAAPFLVSLQLILHCWLAVLPSSGYGHEHSLAGQVGMPMGHQTHLGLTVPMVLAHVVAGLFATWVWRLRRRAVRVLTAWGDTTARIPIRTASAARLPSLALDPSRLLLRTSPRRGPPMPVAA
jgi:hypothetical protein